jgi:hypothetical protein
MEAKELARRAVAKVRRSHAITRWVFREYATVDPATGDRSLVIEWERVPVDQFHNQPQNLQSEGENDRLS